MSTLLQDQLNALKTEIEKNKMPAEAVKIANAAINDLKNSDQLKTALKVGDQFPDFSLKNQDGEVVNSKDLLANGPLVISFFRGVWCPYCMLELSALARAEEEFKALNASVVILSPQNEKFAKKTKRDANLPYDILVDAGNAFAKELNITFTLPEDVKGVYKGFGIDLPAYNGDESFSLPMPTRAVIDQNNVIRYIDINPDYRVRPEVDVTIDALKSL